jgi:large repetitive protein
MSSRSSSRFIFRPRFESLEERALLSASAVGKGHESHAAIVSQPAAVHSETNLVATLTGSTAATGTVDFDSETNHGKTNSTFSVKVADAAANTTLSVAIDGTSVGQITTDANGNGSLTFKTDPHGPKQTAFPANFPATLIAGDKVTVGADLSGTLALPSEATETHTHLIAALSSTTGGTATVNFESSTEDGVTHSTFKVNVNGAAANTTLNVSINGTVVGQVTTDANGNGSLIFSTNPQGPNQSAFPANFPATLLAGDKIAIGANLNGTLTLPGEKGDEGGKGDEGELSLAGKLTGTTSATGSAVFDTVTELGQTLSVFQVKVKGATAGAMLNVALNGTAVGVITVDASGNGSLTFSSNPMGAGVLPFPANFPANVSAGAAISVGTILNGTLSAHESD